MPPVRAIVTRPAARVIGRRLRIVNRVARHFPCGRGEPNLPDMDGPKLGGTNGKYRSGGIEIDAMERCVSIDGSPARVGARAFDVLIALVERRDRVVPKRELMDVVWPRLVVEENNLLVHMVAL